MDSGIFMDAAPNHHQRVITAESFPPRPRHLGHHCALLGLLFAFGVLAFLFSAVSPDDDDIQQQFVQGNKAKQFVLATSKSVPNIRGFRINRVPSALLPPRPLSTRCTVIGRVLSVDEKIIGTIVSSRTGDRSPPSKSS